MNKVTFLSGCIAAFVMLFAGFPSCASLQTNSQEEHLEQIIAADESISELQEFNYECNLNLWNYDGSLVCYVDYPISKYNKSIVRIGQNDIEKIEVLGNHLADIIPIGAVGRYFYYFKGEGFSFWSTNYLWVYDLKTGKSTRIVKCYQKGYLFLENGDLYLRAVVQEKLGKREEIICVSGTEIVEDMTEWPSFTVGNSQVIVQFNDNQKFELHSESNGMIAQLELDYINNLHVFSYDGKLMIQANPSRNPMTIVSEDGNVHYIFPVTAMEARSSVTCRGNQLYISMNQVNWGSDGFYEGDPKDPLTGTFCVNLSDYSYSKISDDYYRQLMMLNDDELCGTNDKGVFIIKKNGETSQLVKWSVFGF